MEKTLRERIRMFKRGHIHKRSIELNSYPVDDGIILEGILYDERFVDIYDIDGSIKNKGPVHHISALILIRGMPPVIEDAEAEFLHYPHELCPQAREGMKSLVGLEIRSGFGEKVHKIIGGKKGCAHLSHLIIVMGHVAMHGLWTSLLRERPSIPSSLEDIKALDYLIDSCFLWKEDGPFLKRFRSLVEDGQRG